MTRYRCRSHPDQGVRPDGGGCPQCGSEARPLKRNQRRAEMQSRRDRFEYRLTKGTLVDKEASPPTAGGRSAEQ
jgi:hypothetical protein